MGYRGPRWPIQRHLTQRVGGDTLWGLYGAFNTVHQDLRGEFAKRAAEIDGDPNLSEVGRQKARRALVEELRSGEPMTRASAAIKDGQARIENLIEQLSRMPDHHTKTPYEQVAYALREDRTLRQFEALTPAARREALDRALNAKAFDFLRALYHEPALLNERDALRVCSALMEGADPALYRELTELAGVPDHTGKSDPTTSALAVAEFTLRLFNDELDGYAGGVSASARLKRDGVKVDDVSIVLSPEQARDAELYQAAKAVALSEGKVLSIAGDEGTASVAPAATDGNNAPS